MYHTWKPAVRPKPQDVHLFIIPNWVHAWDLQKVLRTKHKIKVLKQQKTDGQNAVNVIAVIHLAFVIR